VAFSCSICHFDVPLVKSSLARIWLLADELLVLEEEVLLLWLAEEALLALEDVAAELDIELEVLELELLETVLALVLVVG
jgi:hypothetical protein